MSLELFRNWMSTLYTNVYWPSVCTSIILCCLSMSSTLGMSSTWWRDRGEESTPEGNQPWEGCRPHRDLLRRQTVLRDGLRSDLF